MNKDIFLQVGVRENFNLPKLHALIHYTPSVKLFGTSDNHNTEYSERLHIDYAKDAYRSTNHKDAYPQMTLWLQRKEQIMRHEWFIAWRLENNIALHAAPQAEVDKNAHFHIARFPSDKSANLHKLKVEYGTKDFQVALARYVLQTRNPGLSSRQVEQQARGVHLVFRSVAAFHVLKFWLKDPQDLEGAGLT
ncbi:hypothetical protein BV25DRAFT_1919484 [Artomyces pyxidatus]|uniref:Uncharacterized protein n=1 Tax=Artomyces pyxidatus TaxID=48021 RepID=A0ACB8SNZ0_9AGAM|nr:hypothetical protein BV25DRAFT_1919484 [Artomyces pyxidatus]